VPSSEEVVNKHGVRSNGTEVIGKHRMEVVSFEIVVSGIAGFLDRETKGDRRQPSERIARRNRSMASPNVLLHGQKALEKIGKLDRSLPATRIEDHDEGAAGPVHSDLPILAIPMSEGHSSWRESSWRVLLAPYPSGRPIPFGLNLGLNEPEAKCRVKSPYMRRRYSTGSDARCSIWQPDARWPADVG
jgi:hypothetical protein